MYVAKNNNSKKEEEKVKSAGSSDFESDDSDNHSSSDNDSSDVDLEDVCFVEAMLNHAEVDFFGVGGEDSEESENENKQQIMTTGEPLSLKKDV